MIPKKIKIKENNKSVEEKLFKIGNISKIMLNLLFSVESIINVSDGKIKDIDITSKKVAIKR